MSNCTVSASTLMVRDRPLLVVSSMRWQGLNLDFTGVVFDGGDFTSAVFSRGFVDFRGAVFSGGTVYFNHTKFSGGAVDFRVAEFFGGVVHFRGAVLRWQCRLRLRQVLQRHDVH